MFIEKKKSRLFILSKLSICIFALFAGSALAEETDSLQSYIDSLMSSNFDANGAGATVIVSKDGKPIFSGAYGMANIELGVRMNTEHVLRMGSITKQFTAVCIMMLLEQGKLDLDDEMTKYLPDYPVQGNKVTIRHLLTHTSGIKSYTGIEGFSENIRKDFSVEERIDTFKNLPFDFKPGEEFRYNNSGFFLLGAIIEKVSGLTYEEFLNKNILKPLGMNDSYSEKRTSLIKNRASGYVMEENGFVNGSYYSDTVGYSVGSLASSIGDMAKWDAALNAGKLITQDSLKQCQTTYVLNNGTETYYGFGWGLGTLKGHKYVTHTGGFNSFLGSASSFPDDKIFVAVLANSVNPKTSTDVLVTKIAAMALGKPLLEPVIVDLAEEDLKRVEGSYKIDEDYIREIILEDGKLYSRIGQRPKSQIFPTSKTHFVFKDSLAVFEFVFDENGDVTKMVAHYIDGYAQSATKTKS